jgi:hypothetical protein
LISVADARNLVGYLKTLRLLGNLAGSESPQEVRIEACVELSKWYPLELTEYCQNALAGSAAKNEHMARLLRVRAEVSLRGLPWLEKKIQPENKTEMVQYLRGLKQSNSEETRQLAERLLKAIQ